MLELGGILIFFFHTNNVFICSSITSEISLSKGQFKSGTNAKIGVELQLLYIINLISL
jgi:hypothetical protein